MQIIDTKSGQLVFETQNIESSWNGKYHNSGSLLEGGLYAWTVKFEDGSLVDKGLTLAGAMQGVNADTMKAQVVGMLPTMLKMLEKPAFVDQVTAAVKNFLDKKGTITATATPPAPVLILQLLGAAAGAPGAVVDLLNIKIEAGQL